MKRLISITVISLITAAPALAGDNSTGGAVSGDHALGADKINVEWSDIDPDYGNRIEFGHGRSSNGGSTINRIGFKAKKDYVTLGDVWKGGHVGFLTITPGIEGQIDNVSGPSTDHRVDVTAFSVAEYVGRDSADGPFLGKLQFVQVGARSEKNSAFDVDESSAVIKWIDVSGHVGLMLNGVKFDVCAEGSYSEFSDGRMIEFINCGGVKVPHVGQMELAHRQTDVVAHGVNRDRRVTSLALKQIADSNAYVAFSHEEESDSTGREKRTNFVRAGMAW